VALGTVAVRRPGIVIGWLEEAPEESRTALVELLKDGFDNLEEDFGEEQFFAAARATYWSSAEGSPPRTITALLIEKLEF
jgi:hypothetical protein